MVPEGARRLGPRVCHSEWMRYCCCYWACCWKCYRYRCWGYFRDSGSFQVVLLVVSTGVGWWQEVGRGGLGADRLVEGSGASNGSQL